MVHPLVVDADRAFHRCQMRDGILGKYGNTIAVDQIRDTMMDFRVNMVWTACKDNTMASCLFQIFQGFFPFFLHIAACSSHFLPALMYSSFDFFSRDILKFLYQTIGQNFLRSKCKERIAEGNGRII